MRSEDGPLFGGTANRGQVVRVGDTVHRPAGVHTPAVHRLLTHLAATGFRGSPRVVPHRSADGATHPDDPDAKDVLTYIEGVAAIEPLAPWARTSAALSSVGALLRDYHRHAASFGLGASSERPLRWQRPVPERWRGTLITHNDVNPANVIFREERAVALIDFDLAAPGSPAWELAVAACFWAPLREDADIADTRRGRSLPRFRTLLDGYGAPPALRVEVVEATAAANEWIAGIIHDASRRGHPAFGRLWAAEAEIYARADTWLRANRTRLAAHAR